tara:strand:- start:576 stop:1658 length:1083 start_codon:yes stop_codon:yes gene_type:complete
MRHLLILLLLFGLPIIKSQPSKASSRLCKEETLSTKKLVNSVKSNVTIIQTSDSEGSGFVIGHSNNQTYILTNKHVVDLDKEVYIIWPDGSRNKGIVVASPHNSNSWKRGDFINDLALVRINGITGNALPIKQKNGIIGENVIAIGNPSRYDFTVTRGIVSGLREKGQLIQTDAAINKGNSGGPLINSSGCVVGVISFIAPDNVGLNFAVSSTRILRFLNNSGYAYLQKNLSYDDADFKENKNYLNNEFATPNNYETDKRIQNVKNGTMNFCDNVTVDTLVNNYIANPSWYAFKADDGEDYVNIEGQIYYYEELVDILLQYKIDIKNGLFEVYAFTIEGKPQTINMIDNLIESMCEVVSR